MTKRTTSRLNRDRYQKKLRDLLSRTNDEGFFQMAWAAHALQSGRRETASRYLRFPREAIAADRASPYAANEWDLETLISELLTTPKLELLPGRPNRRIDCSQFNAVATMVKYLRNLENAETGMYLDRIGIWTEMHRIAQRQFSWQRRFFDGRQLYRYAYLYGSGDCAEYFARAHGLTVHQFSHIGFALFAHFQSDPGLRRSTSLAEIGIGPAEFESSLRLLSTTVSNARREAASMIKDAAARHNSPVATAYRPSILRRFPILSFGNHGERLRAPLPELVLHRVTAGVFYDLLAGGAHLRNEASERFENYSAKLIGTMMPRFEIKRSEKYVARGNRIETPDILVKDGAVGVVVMECKATKLNFDAQFAGDPTTQARTAYDGIGKGVFQLWRYFSHVRRGLASMDVVSPDAHGIVLTLDTWLVLSRELEKDVLDVAARLAEKDPEITAADRRHVVFCAVQDLEMTLAGSNEDSFLRALVAAHEPRFVGWQLPNIYREIEGPAAVPKGFPFKLEEVLPWWEDMGELQAGGPRTDPHP